MTTQYEKIPAPGFVSPTATFTDPEILYSTVGHTQKGVTLAPGQGVLPAGQALGRRTADKLWYAYDNAIADGRDTCRGFLRKPADTGPAGTTERQQGNIVISGILKNNTLVGVDAAAMTDLNAMTDDVLGTFKFGF